MDRRRIERAVPVVVVGESLNSLGVVRGLAVAGLTVHVVATTRWCPAATSRFANLVRLPSLEGATLVDGLVALGQRLGGRPVLMLGGDREVDTVNSHRDRLAPLFRFDMPPANVVRELANKAAFQQFAERHGLPVPRGVVVSGEHELHLLAELDLPLVIKPADKLQVLSGKVERAVRVDTVEQARALVTGMMRAAGSVIAQEWIPGDDSDIYFSLFVCDRHSRAIAMFCGRKLICSPPEVGSTEVCCAAGEASEELVRLSERFIAHSGYRGIGGVEFKRDRRDGRFVIVEPTVGRTDWQAEIATLCGVNLPLHAYFNDLDLPSPEAPQVALARNAWSSSLFHQRRGGLASDIRVRDGYLRLNDPLPGLHHYLVDELARRAARRIGRLFRAS
jgi:predicted ATP-grasp superfamily ATP-dependent carboligase